MKMKMKMKRQIVIDTIQHKTTAHVPYNIELTSELLEKVCETLRIAPRDFFDYAGNYIEKVGYNQHGVLSADGMFTDEFGVVWNRSGLDKDIGIVETLIFDEPQFDDFVFPEPDYDAIRADTKRLLANGRDTCKLGKLGLSYFERAWSMRGFENLLMDFLTEEEFVDELFAKILEYNKKIIATALAFDIDGFYFGDDYGTQNGLIMSPDVWRRFVKPGLAEMFGMVKAQGKFVALHSCGNISEILEDLVEIGLDVYQTVQPEIYDLKTLKQQFGGRLAFWGAISTQRDLPNVSPAELKKIMQETIEILGHGGGFIVAPTHQVPADVPVENIVVMIEFLKEPGN